MSIFTAKREVVAHDVDVEGGRVLITPPCVRQLDVNGKEEHVPANVNFQIKDVDPIKLTDEEWEDLKTTFIAAARRSSNLKEVAEIKKKEVVKK